MKKYTIRMVKFMILLIGIAACEDTINLPLNNNISKLVVVGEITDQNKPPQITLSRTVAYSDSSSSPRVSGAMVNIIDDLGESIKLTELSETGVYKADEGVAGEVGRTYTLKIQLPDGKKYESFPEKLNPVEPIDSLTAEFRADEGEDEASWRVKLSFSTPADIIQYYRWKLFINDMFEDRLRYLHAARFKSLADDEELKIIYPKLPINNGDKLRIEQLSLTEEAQQFLVEVATQADLVAGPFDPPVAPIIGNIRNKDDVNDFALGYFFASSVASDSLVIK